MDTKNSQAFTRKAPLAAATKEFQEQTKPASTGQQRIWYITQTSEPRYVYNDQLEVRIQGSLDVSFLEQSLTKIVDRHQALRTVFRQTKNGKLLQVILAPFQVKVPLISIDKDNLDNTEIEQAISHVSLEQGRAEYDLATGPLFRACILQLPKNCQVFLFSFHHSIMDGRSLVQLLKEINALYLTESQNGPKELEESIFQDTEYAHWEEEWIQTEDFRKRLEYWKTQFKDAPASLNLPVRHSKRAHKTSYGAWKYLKLPRKLTVKLSALAQSENVSLYTVLLAAYKTLLMAYSGQLEISVGTVIANRPDPKLKTLMGFCAETVVLNSNLSAEKTFKQFLKELRAQTNEVFYKQAVPFNKVVDIARKSGHSKGISICQTAFIFRSIPFESSVLAGNKISHPTLKPMGVAKFDLSVSLELVEECLQGYLEYSTDLFDQSTIERLCQHYQVLLEGIVENPNQSIGTLPLLSEPEKQQLLVDWNQTEAPYPRDRCIHTLFERQVADTPDAIAVVFEDQQLTYDELNQRSNQLAHYLVEQGVGPEVRVGLCLERSFEMVIGILGILKAGGAYVPMDPEYPLDRLSYMIEDSQLLFILSQSGLPEALSQLLHSNNAILLDQEWEQIRSAEKQNNVRKREAQAHNLAYVIYTSGSTGKPKGVMVNHQNVLNTLHFLEQTYPVQKNDAYLLKTNYVFDVSLSELFGWFLGPGRLAILPPEEEKSPESMIEHIEKHAITHLNFAPSMLSVFVEEARQNRAFISRCPLKYLMVAGEAFPKPLVKACVELFSTTSVENIYGPTESSIYSAWYSCRQGEVDSEHTPIGRPINNTQLYVVDSHLQPVPIGVAGELCIAGAGLARGYLNRPELTEKAFIDNPFNPSSKLYKTGDVVRYLTDGNIEYIGRVDHQVKVRGFRIELGEIENTLTEQEGIREAIVLAHSRDGSGGNHYLAAYLVHEQGLDIDHNQLRENLKASLPDYMVPSFFIQLDELPLTPNGKVDRKALPIPHATNLQTQEYAPPQTDIEKVLVNGWSEVLGIDPNKISIHSNFFELGGDSILSLQTITRAKNAGIKISPKQLFEHPSIAELSKVAQKVSTVKTEQGQITGSLPLLPVQHWFFEKVETDYHHFNQSFMLKTLEKLDENVLKTALNALTVHHDVLRLRFSKSEDGWNQTLKQWYREQLVSSIDLSMLKAEAQRTTIEEEASSVQKQLDIHRGPVLRATIFYMGRDLPDLLLIAIHHLAIDGVSWRILLDDLVTAYHQAERGIEIKLPEKTTSYKDWAEQVKNYSQSESLLNELSYWQRLGLHTTNSLPQDRQSTTEENTEASARTLSINLSIENTRRLLQDVPAAYNTQINDILLTALALAFNQWTGHNSLLLDLEGHGREDIFDNVDLSRTIGWFTSIYPVHLALDSPSDLGESIKSVKEQLREIPERGVGYGMLRYCNDDPAINNSLVKLPAAQISFNYLGQFDQDMGKDSFLQWTDEPTGATHSPHQTRTCLIDFIGLIFHGRLQLNIIYSQAHYETQTMKKLGTYLLKNLEDLIEHCSTPDNYGYTPSDFSDADMSPDELNELMESFGAAQ